ncbi:MAG: hypothetical protein WC387_00120 [Candidatus Paceibacterota bacterium]
MEIPISPTERPRLSVVKTRDSLLGDTSIITEQFKNAKEYQEFAEDILPDIIERKKSLKELERMMIDED